MKANDVTLEDQLSFARRARDYWNGDGTKPAEMHRAISMPDTWNALVSTLEEHDGMRRLVARQSELLCAVVNVIRGEPPPDTLWSHHDAPRLVADLKNWAAAMEASRNFWQTLANDRADVIIRLQGIIDDHQKS
jgi:hypothetical protein